MSLVFQRTARNFAKAGYFPTDLPTVEASLAFLAPGDGEMQLLDPCCGEGVALDAVGAHLSHEHAASTFGIEFDEERAYEAKQRLSKCIHGDINDCVTGLRQFSLLWLNPPYGDLVSDHSDTRREGAGRQRLEKQFYKRSWQSLVFGGVMILIIPSYTLDREFCTWLTRHFSQLLVRRAADQVYQQVVIFGTRKAGSRVASVDAKAIRERLLEIGKGITDVPCITDRSETDSSYTVPASSGVERFYCARMDARQLSDAAGSQTGLWPQHRTLFATSGRRKLRPLCPLSEWHMALALASGQLNGLVSSADGRQLLVKGDTYKTKRISEEVQLDPDGKVIHIRTATDNFVPSIVGLDFTQGSDRYGDLVRVR